MSIATWKAEFAPYIRKDASVLKLVEWCIRKWEGLAGKHLRRHGLTRDGAAFQDSDSMAYPISPKACPLCVRFDPRHRGNCRRCPLRIVRGGKSCTDNSDGHRRSPYDAFLEMGRPEAMIALLKKTKAMLEANAKPKPDEHGGSTNDHQQTP